MGSDELTHYQQWLVKAGREPGVLVPDTVKTAEQYRAWVKSRMTRKGKCHQ